MSADVSTPSILTLKPFIDPQQIAKDLSVNPNDLDDAMTRHAGLFFHYAAEATKARSQFEIQKAAFEIMESRLYSQHRRDLEVKAISEFNTAETTPGETPAEATKTRKTKDKAGPAKVTEAQIAAAVKNDPRWWTSNKRLIDARQIYELAEATVSSFSHRKDMILETARDRRKEREGQIRMGAAQDAKDMVMKAIRDSGVLGDLGTKKVA